MTFRVPGSHGPGAGRPVVLPRWPRFVIPAVIIIVLAIVLIAVVAGIWTDFLWYRSVHQTRVFSVTYTTKWLLFLVVAAFMVLVVGSNIWLAHRLRPEVPPAGSQHQGVEAYRQAIDPHRRGVLIVLLGLIGLVTGLAAASDWRTWLLFVNRVPFGRTDPQFHLDISFFVFVYPFLRLVLSFLFAAVLLSLVLAAVVHVLYGGLRLARHANPTRGARAQLFVLAGVFVVLKAAAYWVDRYGINFSQRGVVPTGASFTDVHAVLPAKTVLAVIALICAALLLAGAFRRSALLPAIGLGLLVLSAVIIGGVYPFVIQQFVVKPNQQVKEQPYIKREIASTRDAYGVAGSAVTTYTGLPSGKATALASEAATTPDLRIIDPGVMSSTFEQLQQVKGYYQFQRVLAMDRYHYGPSAIPQDTVVGVRDMQGPPAGQRNWVNTHLIYTHGYGFVGAAASTAQPDGSPSFVEGDIPPTGVLGRFQPRVYFGHEGASYVIVGGRQPELDYPNASSGGQHNFSYTGGGGVPVGSLASRLAFAVKFRDLNILISSAIDANSRILYTRDPLQRVEKVAPFLTLDGDPYPVIAHGQILWVVDGYTTTDDYPYSKRIGLGQATTSTYNPHGLAVGPAGQVNYIRNSVKATVNAYTGAVHLYQWGKPSPILQAWKKSFPGLISPQRDIPAGVLSHLRYPEGLFEAQRLILTQFHVTDPASFYGGQNFWAVPSDPSILENKSQKYLAGISQPPYYLTMSMPRATTPAFSLTSVLTFRNRANLAAYVAVNSDPLSPQYGHIQILQLPQSQVISGPGQIQNQFESFTAASIELTQLRKGGSQVIQGNLVTIPLGNSFLSVEPVYVAASAQGNPGTYPQLKRVFTYFNGQVGYASSLTGSLAELFGSLGQQPTGPGTGGTGHVSALVLQYLRQAENYYNQAQAALRNGQGLGVYYQDIQKMKTALDNARQAAQGASKGTPGTSPSPSPSGSPSPVPTISPAAPSPSPSG
ncbi:MAG TPA: UPF0182 family protein [Streptosporangiaceae bacterium]